MAKKKKVIKNVQVSKETVKLKTQHVAYVSRADEIQERITTRNKILAEAAKKEKKKNKWERC